MFAKFWKRYPQGSLTSELVTVDRGQYIVRALVQVKENSLASGFGMANSLEEAEDQARHRALAILDLDATGIVELETATVTSETPQTTVLKTSSVVSETVNPSPAVSSPRSKVSVSQIEHPTTVSSGNEKQPVLPTVNPTQEIEPKPATTPTSNQSNLFEDQSPLPETPSIVPPEPVTEATVQESPHVETQAESTPGISQDDLMEKTGLEVRRLNWTAEQGKQYLIQTYGQPSRSLLTNQQLLEFLQYLQAQPSPNSEAMEESPQENVEESSSAVTEETPASEKELPVVNGEIDVIDLLAKTKAEMNRLGWTKEDEKEHLLNTYGKRSRQYLGDGEFLDFLEYLQQQP